MRFLIAIAIVAATGLGLGVATDPIGAIMQAVRLTAEAPTVSPPTETAAATATPEATTGPIATPHEPADCQSPPPWADRATAERCHTLYPPPFGEGVVVNFCNVTGELSYLLCYGYWLVPGVYYPLLTQTPAGGLPTLQPSYTVTPQPPISPTPSGYPAPYP